MTTKASTAPVRLSAEAVIPLRTVDPVGPLDDLEWLDQAIGDSRVVARRLSPPDTNAVRAASQPRAGIGAFYADQSRLDAFDVIVHLPSVTAAEPDHAAPAHTPHDVQDAFSLWKPE